MPITPGQSLTHYTILAPLGAGAMGEVYRARDTRLDREVAIKVLPEHFADDEERLRRFEREARALASLNHPNVAQVFGIDQVEDTCFIVMELVPGETLEDRLARGPLGLDEALEVCGQVAEGLEAAHEAGVIHRDLKPANVRVTPEGKVKVLDFGLAKATGTDAGSGLDSTAGGVLTTEEGRLLGTPTYMAPEQARGRRIDRRVDVWAFGCLLFECLGGARAFTGDTLADVLSAVIGEEPDWSRLPQTTPAHVREVLRRCLQKEPARRLRDVGDAGLMLADAGAVGAGAGPGGARVSPAVLAVVALGAAAIGAGLTALSRSGSDTGPTAPAPVTHLAVPQPDQSWPGESRGSSLTFGISPDGQSLAYWGVRPGPRGKESVLEVWDRATGRSTTFTGVGALVGDPVFSPDGRWIAYSTESHLMRVLRADGQDPKIICSLPGDARGAGDLRGASWLDDGTIVFGLNEGPLYRVSVDEGQPTPLTTLAPGETAHAWPAAVPGTQVVVFTVAHGGTYDLAVVEAGSGPHQILLAGASFGRPLGAEHLVYFQGSELRADTFDPGTRRLRGAPVPLDLAVYENSWSGKVSLAIALDGTLAYTAPPSPTSEGRTLVWVDRDGLEQDSGFPPRSYRGIALSPDGKRVVVSLEPTLDSNELWIGDTATGRLKPFHDINGYWPQWGTPDAVLYVDRADHGLRRHSVDGPGPEEVLGQTAVLPAAMSFDGRELVFAKQGRSTGFDLWRLRAGQEAAPLWTEQGYQATASFSHDGSLIAWGSYLAAGHELAVGASLHVSSYPDLDRAQAQVPITGVTHPVLRADGSEIYFEDDERILVAALSTSPTLAIGSPRVLCRAPYMNTGGRRFDVDQGSGRILVMREDPLSAGGRPELFVIMNWGDRVKAACGGE
jgi:tRNA A-37 threonylcarbamoyl transferase component Bud32/WD40 repeat protein